MGYTLRNVFFLLAFALLAVKGFGHFAETVRNDRGARVHRVTGHVTGQTGTFRDTMALLNHLCDCIYTHST